MDNATPRRCSEKDSALQSLGDIPPSHLIEIVMAARADIWGLAAMTVFVTSMAVAFATLILVVISAGGIKKMWKGLWDSNETKNPDDRKIK